MNYRKTKTIQKNGTIIRASLLSYLLLFFLLISCGRKSFDEDSTPRPITDVEKHNKQVHAEYMESVGGIGPCTDECLGNNFVELAKGNKKTATIEGVESHIIPSKDKANNMPILKSITEEKFVGNQEGKGKWFKWRNRQTQKGRKVREGIFGVAGDMLKIISVSKDQHKDAIIYTAFLTMELRTKLDQVPSWSKAAITDHNTKAFADFEEKLKAVAPDANGIRVIIPIDNPKLTFQPLTEAKKSRKNRPYRLPENLYKELMAEYEKLKKTVSVAEERLK